MTWNLESGLGFSQAEIEDCVQRGGLLSLELEFTRQCNLRCLYCYASAGEALVDELSLSELLEVVDQARALGARRVVLLGGGEPLLFPRLPEVIQHIHSLGLSQALFTNGMLLTARMCQFLAQRRVTVVVKHNSFSPPTQDLLAGVAGAHARIRGGLDLLLDAGYPDAEQRLGIQTILCQPNRDEIEAMWIWARERNITPYFEVLTEQGRARQNPQLMLPSDEIRALFEALARVDRDRFGIQWMPRPPIAGFTCRRHLYSCLITSQGAVHPCPGVDVSVGNIRRQPLEAILRESAVIRDLRSVYHRIALPCRTCQFAGECYGCRGHAYQVTGDYLAADPMCWHQRLAVAPPLASLGV